MTIDASLRVRTYMGDVLNCNPYYCCTHVSQQPFLAIPISTRHATCATHNTCRGGRHQPTVPPPALPATISTPAIHANRQQEKGGRKKQKTRNNQRYSKRSGFYSCSCSRVAEDASVLGCFWVGQSVRYDLRFAGESHLNALLLSPFILMLRVEQTER